MNYLTRSCHHPALGIHRDMRRRRLSMSTVKKTPQTAVDVYRKEDTANCYPLTGGYNNNFSLW